MPSLFNISMVGGNTHITENHYGRYSFIILPILIWTSNKIWLYLLERYFASFNYVHKILNCVLYSNEMYKNNMV